MGNGRILSVIPIITEQPLPSLPKLFFYIHTIADENYFSYGHLRPSENHCVFHYTLRGNGECYNGNKVYTISANQGFIQVINDKDSGYRYPINGNTEWEFLCFCFDGGNSISMTKDIIKNYGPVFDINPESAIIKRLSDEAHWKSHSTISNRESAECFYALYFYLLKQMTCSHDFDQEILSNANRKIVSSAKLIIEEGISSSPSVEEIAGALNVTREHLSRIFKHYTGKGIKQYISERRILVACDLLKNTDIEIKEIANQLSFSTSTNFIRFFKTIMQVTPDFFRKNGFIPYF